MLKTRNLISLAAILAGSGMLGCDKVADAAGSCLPECKLELIANGNGAITGDASFDTFFGAVANINTKAKLIASAVAEAQGKLALLVGANSSSSADIVAAFDAKIAANTMGGIQVAFKPPKCSASVSATLDAQAKCEGMVTPPMASVACSGKCEASASAMVMCEAGATLSCKGTAPNLECNGTCSGECSAEVTAEGSCTGSCSGTCMGTCTVNSDVAVMCNGTCNGSTDAGGNCTGGCETDMSAGGTCMGTCGGMCMGDCTGKIEANGSCSGQCKGECEYTPASGSCETDAKVQCQASAGANVMCNGSCEGEVTPPMGSVECDASVKAEAKASAECTPPTIGVDYQFMASAEFQTQAEFEAFVNVFFETFAELQAQGALIGELTGAANGLVAATANVQMALQAQAEAAGEGDVLAAAGLQCGIEGLVEAGTVLTAATGSLSASAMAIGQLTAGVTS